MYVGQGPLKSHVLMLMNSSPKIKYARLAEDFSSEGGERCIALYSYSGEAESSMGLQVPRFDRHLLICHYRQWQCVLYKLAYLRMSSLNIFQEGEEVTVTEGDHGGWTRVRRFQQYQHDINIMT